MIGYVIRQHWTGEALLDDGSWSADPNYDDRVEVFSCQVRANRRAWIYQQDGWDVSVCPWEIEPPSIEVVAEDVLEPSEPPLSSDHATASDQMLFGQF